MEKQKYTVFCDELGGIPGYWPSYDGQSLEEVIEACAASTLKLTPTAWAPAHHGSGGWEALKRESIAAGRTIEKIGDRYIPRGHRESEEKPKQAFRVGAFYRQRNSAVVRVMKECEYTGTNSKFYPGKRCLQVGSGGWRNSLGQACNFGGGPLSDLDLLPGELTFVNGGWVAVEHGWDVGCGVGISKTPTLDKLERSSSCAKRDSDENHRPALTWDKPVRIDRFPGFVVKSDSGAMVEADNSPYTRLGDTSNPLHGSFALVKKD